MAHIGDIPVNLDDGIWRARASNPDGYIRNARFYSLQIENEDGKALVTLYFARAKLQRVQQLAALLNEIANPVTRPDAGAHHERHNLPVNSPGLPPTFPIVGPDVELVETGVGEA